MPIIDIIIAVAIIISIIVGFIRGFIKEAISIAALILAIWAAMYLGPAIGNLADSWLSSRDLQLWFGRILVFAVVLSVGELLGWGLSKLIRLSVLNTMGLRTSYPAVSTRPDLFDCSVIAYQTIFDGRTRSTATSGYDPARAVSDEHR